MTVLMILILLALTVLAVRAVAQWVTARRLERLYRDAKWELDEVLEEAPDGTTIVRLYAIHPARKSRLIGGTPLAGDDFDYAIEELRSLGETKLVALNNRPKRLNK